MVVILINEPKRSSCQHLRRWLYSTCLAGINFGVEINPFMLHPLRLQTPKAPIITNYKPWIVPTKKRAAIFQSYRKLRAYSSLLTAFELSRNYASIPSKVVTEPKPSLRFREICDNFVFRTYSWSLFKPFVPLLFFFWFILRPESLNSSASGTEDMIRTYCRL